MAAAILVPRDITAQRAAAAAEQGVSRYTSQPMFIPRMWFDEVERIGKQRCTPFGYALQGIGDLAGFLGLLTLLGMPVYLVYQGVVGTVNWSSPWLMAVPFVIGIVGRVMVEVSWWMAFRKKFHYSYERRESTWVEAGEKRSYTFSDWEAAEGRRIG
jgi:hypothetical protein